MNEPRVEQAPNAAPIAASDSVRTRSADSASALALRLIAANARLNAIALVTAVVLVALGLWVHFGVKQSLRDIRAAGMQTVLEAEIKALQVWVEDRKVDAEHWASDARVRGYVEALTVLGHSQRGTGDALWESSARARLVEVLAPALKEGSGVAFNVVDTSGLIVATQFREYSGRRVNPGTFLADLSEVFKGSTRFIRPYLERDRVGNIPSTALVRPVVWFEAPVRDERGDIIAALGVAHHADGEFANIFNVVRLGKSGETYAFDANGVMLSESRFVDELKKVGLVPDAAGAGAMLRVQIRDPGGNLLDGYRPGVELAARPRTQLAALAIASRQKAEADERQGVILDPYRNYRGVDVIGAWKWLADYDLGVAIEVAASEAYAPLVYLNLAFTVILTLLATALGAVLWSSVYVKRLRRHVGDARVIGQYRLEKQLGEGGMGKVYLARHTLLKRPTALKMLKPHLASDEIVARFEREVQLASQLVHPNTVEIYDYGRTRDGVFYYVMEYLEGRTADEIVQTGGPLPATRVIHVLKQVCAALREAHGRGLVHRDIKPHNIMLCLRGGEYDVVKILDFGLVKDIAGRQSRDITQFQKMLGTPLYMSPERLRNPGDADARADIYSVGAVGFYLLTGRDLFETSGAHDLTYHVLHSPPRRASECVPGIPKRLDDLILRCLAKERSERPHDILVVLALLEALSVEFPWSQRDAQAWWQARRAAAAKPAARS
jgi:eukaryotic-like serine/threonine-protein kinase